ncbi:hypothetical protein EV424DRAFT_1538717 [Suillus variegatus]|nr:hypothetical protein EV424DRAFT_1538717 [Suillus variegatus]
MEDSVNDDNTRLSRLGLGEADAGPAWQSKVPKFRVLVHSPSNHVYIPPISPTRITVQRRFSHFIVLHTSPTRRLPGIALPPLPEKQFVEANSRDILGIVRHPVVRYAEVVTSFLGCDNDADWKRLMPWQLLSMPAAGPSFFAHVFYPAFNVDVDDATEVIDCFSRHTLAVGKGTQSLSFWSHS